MSLIVTSVSQCLEKKLTIAGYEIPDLLAIFSLMSVLNFLLGWMGHRFLLVWAPTLFLATLLRVGKKGKPDNHLFHLLKFRMTQKYFSAFSDPKNYQCPPGLTRKVTI